MTNLILICGRNTVFSKEKLADILKERKQFFKEDYVLYDLSQDSFSLPVLKTELSSRSLFFEQRVIVIKSVLTNEKFKKEFVESKEFLEKSQGLIIFFEPEDVVKTDVLYKFIKKHGQIHEFRDLDTNQARDYIAKQLSVANFKMDLSAIQELLHYIGNDFWRLKYELSKLMALKIKERIINKADIVLIVKPEIENDIFKTIEAIAQKDKKKALGFLYKHLEKGDSAPYLFSMIAFQFRNILLVKDALAKNPNMDSSTLKSHLKGINPFVIQKSLWLAKGFDLNQLHKIYKKIFQMDLSVKSGKLQPEEALEILLLDI